jgi:asparagine synthase (glutamine-hydrolysing)
MCGLAGFAGFDGADNPRLTAERMAAALIHRGPDASGLWLDAEAEVALAHRRLSIVDLSPAGAQPMVSHAGRFVLSYNGEIYNFREIVAALEHEGHVSRWRGHSDTEVLLEAIAAWGVARALEHAAGMFAFAVYDKRTRRLTLARDRLGEKPLYYARLGRAFVFASELKALACHPAWSGEIDRCSVAAFMRHNNVPAPRSIYRGVRKLKPGHILELDLETGRETERCYWDPLARARQAPRFEGSPEEAAQEAETLLRRSVSGQMVADVPLGAFLSGGIDSSTVVALMQAECALSVRTFTIGFDVAGYDEAPHAAKVARHLGTDHTEFYVTEQDALDVIPQLPQIFCEPFADSSQIPTFLVSKLARQHVTVALSGDGGDELFCGYTRYDAARRVWPLLSRLPVGLRGAAAGFLTRIPPQAWDKAAGLGARLARREPIARFGDKVHKSASVITARDPTDLYAALVSHWHDPAAVVIGANEEDAGEAPHLGSAVRDMMFRDLEGYLPDDILVKVDRAAMAVSLETRAPMLDHRLVEFTWTLPESILTARGRSKWPLRQILGRYLPTELIERPKMGFGIPLDSWLRGRLRDWAESLLAEKRLRDGGLFEPGVVRAAWADHLSGHRNLQYQLWNVLMFEAWRQSIGGNRVSVPEPSKLPAVSSA